MEESKILHIRLLEAVKACQTNLGGKHELVTGASSWVSCLCAQIESVFQHKLKPPQRSLDIIKQVALNGTYEEPSFWGFVKNHLTKHEVNRFENLVNIRTEIGRGRAWVRCALNEHSLERYLYIILGDNELLNMYYDTGALLLDEEIASTLPSMAGGLASIYFSIEFDISSLDGKPNPPTSLVPNFLPKPNVDATTNSKIEAAAPEKVKKRVGKKKKLNVISFDDDSSTTEVDGVSQKHTSEKYDFYEVGESPRVGNGENPWSIGEEIKRFDNIRVGKDHADSNVEGELTKTTIVTQQETSPIQQKVKTAVGSATSHQESASHQESVASQQLRSIRHDSAGGHDLIMDDWSVRSSSVSGAFAIGDSSYDFYPVVDAPRRQLESPVSPMESVIESVATRQDSESCTSGKNSIDSENLSELRQSLIKAMQRKDDALEANRSMRKLLDTEMQRSSLLRAENEKLSAELKQITLSHQNSVKENEVLRSQLKKYVGAVQILESGSAEERVYEQKLVEVAEMHAELMEFNDHLHARFKSAVNFLHHMRAELIDLRGPMPTDELVDRIENDDLSGILESTPSPARISVWMPSVFLRGHGPDSSHFYQVFIRAGEEEWNVYRRYSEFYELHMQIAKKFPIVETYNFPPKKVLGNKGRRFVEERRKVLQTYIRLLINNIIRNHEKIVSNPTKQTLVALLPFFSESLSSDWDKKQHDSAKSKRGKFFRRTNE